MIINTSWANLKAFAVDRALSIQYVVASECYYLAAIDGRMELLARISKDGTDANDQTDFETNFMPAGNSFLGLTSGRVLVDHSGTTSPTLNTSTMLAPANSDRKYLIIQNIDSASIWINFTSDAAVGTPGSLQLVPGAALTFEGTSATIEQVNVASSSTSVMYTAKGTLT